MRKVIVALGMLALIVGVTRAQPGGPPGGLAGPPQPGQVLPAFLQDQLKLTADQKKQVEALQKETDDQLAKILTEEQKKSLKDLRARPGIPGGGGPPGGVGGLRPGIG